MRNLKKFLALVLAMMMTLSLMVTVNAATTYPDQDKAEPKFNEAIDVLSGVGVIKGDDKGNFNPTDNITRAEAAAIMYRIVTGDVDDDRDGLHTGAVNFTDVKDSDWFAGYVGYCADQGIIKGRPDGSFGPQANVTGYEMLAMLLRAVGYGQKNEFTGPGWEIPVGSRATQLGILNNVKTTIYGGNLRTAARRDVVADLAFQTITVPPTVTVSSLGDYNEYTSLVSGVKNPTLGKKVFGLDSYTGVIVGNQQTGEEYTKLAMSMNADGTINSKLNYGSTTEATMHDTTFPTPAFGTDTLVLAFDAETGVDLFGHKAKIWFDNRTSSGAKESTIINNTTGATKVYASEFGGIYAVIDKATKTAVVSSASATDDRDDLKDTTPKNGYLGGVVKAADFTIASDDKAYVSDAYSAIVDRSQTAVDTKAKALTSDTKETYVYQLISNSTPDSKGKCQLDVMISLAVEVQTISKVNAFDSTKSVTVKAGDNSTETTIGTDDAFDTGYEDILVYGKDDIKVGSYVVSNAIYGTSTDLYGDGADGTNVLWGINALTKTESGVITGIAGNGKVTLSTGKVLEMSPMFAVGAPVNAAAAAQNAARNHDLMIGSNMTFTLDKDGKYVGAKPATETYIYADYAYYVQEGIDSFKYFLKGVGLDGKELTVEIDKTSYEVINNANVDDAANGSVDDIRVMSSNITQGTANVRVPAKPGALMHALYVVDGLKQGTAVTGATTPLTVAYTGTKTYRLTADSTTSVTLTPDTKYIDNSTPLAYITDETQFHVLTGWGSTMKVETFTGLKALIGDATSYNVQGIYTLGSIDTEHTGTQNSGISHMIIINGKKVGTGSFLYAGAATTSSGYTKDSKADQFALYVAGESTKSSFLVTATTPGTPGSAPNTSFTIGGHDFYDYTVTPEGYYTLTALSKNVDGTKWVIPEATGLKQGGSKMGYIKTNNNDDIEITDSTKIIDITDPNNGIDSYAKLSQAIEENVVKADILQTAEGSGVAAIIYVYDVAGRP